MADEPRNSSIVDDKTALEALSDFIQSIGGTIVNIKRYPTGSSIIDMALERCMASLDRLFRDYASFTLSESERLLVVDAETLPEKYQARAFVRSFIDSMIARNIRSMSFERGLTHEEILAFLKLVGEKPEDLKQRGRLPDLIKDAGVTHVSIDQKVFVAVTSEERVAKLSDLERLAKSGSDDVDPGEFREGQFLSHMIAKLPFDELGISPDQVDSLKKHIDFDRLKNAREVDFEKLGAYLARAMDQMSGADKVDDEAIADPAAKVTKELRQVDTRAGRIVETFVEISETILRFQHPEIRARLLAHFIKIITNFKELTLAKILTARLADSEDLDIKGQILSQISAKKKSRVIDLLLRKYVRLIEGLTADDFEMEPQEVVESERILKKILVIAKEQERRDLADKAQKALAMASMVAKESANPENLLLLKMKRLFAKGQDILIENDFLDCFGELVRRIEQAGRPEILRKLLERVAQNFASEDTGRRTATVDAFVRINQELVAQSRMDLLGEGYSLLGQHLQRETEPAIFARILATIVADFHKLIELGDVVTPANILRQMTRQHDETSDASRRTIFGQALAKLRGDAGTADRLVSLLQGSNERDSEAAGKLLAMFDAEAVLVKVLHVIRDHEDMRIRKRLLSFVGRFGETARDQILAELSPVSPWYYNRNLLNLLADIADDSMVPRITAHLEAKDERERRAAFAALARISGDGAQEALAESFDRQPESIRKSFIQHFGKTRARSAVPKLLDHLKSLAITDQTESYAVSIIHALGQIGDAAGAAAIRELLHKGSGLRRFFAKPSDAVIEASIVALGQIGDAAAAGSIKGFTRHANPQIARAAQESMRALGRTA